MIHRAPEFLDPLTPVNLPLRRCPVSREQASHRILIMRAGAFGDILMGTPLLAALRTAYPNAHITWIAEHSEAQAIDANPDIDAYVRWDSKYWKKPLRSVNYLQWLWRAQRSFRDFRGRRFDIFISFQPEEWPLLLKAVAAPIRIGVFDTFRRFYRATKPSRWIPLYTHAYRHPDLPDHRVDQYLLTLKALDLPNAASKQMTMGFTAKDAAAASAFLERNGIGEGEPFVVDVPLTTWPTKCWPAERHAALCTLLAARHGLPVVLIGSRKEQDEIARIAAMITPPPIVAAGALTFREMAALVARASLLVSGDTGPMHVAAAVGAPHVALFGATSPNWYGPLEGRGISMIHPVPCGPCDQKKCPNVGDDHEKCMRLLEVDEVLANAERLLDDVRSGGDVARARS